MALFASSSSLDDLLLLLEEDWAGIDLANTAKANNNSSTNINSDYELQELSDVLRVLQLQPTESTSVVDSLVVMIIRGDYFGVVGNTGLDSELSLQSLMTRCTGPVAIDEVQQYVRSYLLSDTTTDQKVLQTIIVAIAYFRLFVQANFTGPELTNAVTDSLSIIDSNQDRSVRKHALAALESDGSYAYNSIEIPQALLVSRILLMTVADPTCDSWKKGIALQYDGSISRHISSAPIAASLRNFLSETIRLDSVIWWSARAAVVHARVLQDQLWDHHPTLWEEAKFGFTEVLARYCGTKISFTNDNRVQYEDTPTIQRHYSIKAKQVELQVQVWLEWGLCQHHFGYSDKGKLAFYTAKKVAGLKAELSAAMGKRTKYQQTDYAQLFLSARSSLVPSQSGDIPKIDTKLVDFPQAGEILFSAPPSMPEAQAVPESMEWQHGEYELGKRLVNEVEGGDVAAVREVLLDSTDGGAQENILLEGGPRFTALDNEGTEKANLESELRSSLHPVDQAIILGLCLDVSNSNPADGLTNEEMAPYIERVLQQANNWMIHSTALLERSWLEFEKRRTMDRAMLQIQALLDQHTTKLTLMQSSFKCIEESAPARDRLRYIHSIVYLAQHELKKDLAYKYMRSQVFVSALNLFRELELWDEVVKCYQFMEKPQRAEMVVREQLKFGETPYMLTAMGDLTGKEEFYHRAWNLSNGRYPRAMRTLSKIAYDSGRYDDCVNFMDKALQIQPLIATAWYLRGNACMHLERWKDALNSFLRCKQQDDEIAEAVANMGAIHMKLGEFKLAYEALTEALKSKRDSWRILENLMMVCLSLKKWRDVVNYMNALLDLRHKSQRPVHVEELRYLATVVSYEEQQYAKVVKKQKGELVEEDEEEIVAVTELSPVAKEVDKLIVRITNTLNSDPSIWDIYAEFHEGLGRRKEVAEARIKQVFFSRIVLVLANLVEYSNFGSSRN